MFVPAHYGVLNLVLLFSAIKDIDLVAQQSSHKAALAKLVVDEEDLA